MDEVLLSGIMQLVLSPEERGMLSPALIAIFLRRWQKRCILYHQLRKHIPEGRRDAPASNSRFADYIANGLFSESGFITNYHKQ